MYKRSFSLAVVAVVGFPVLAAGGLIERIGEGNAWARFRVEAEGQEEALADVPAVLTVGVFGKAKVDGQPCRWLEVYLAKKQDQEPEIIKLLVPEEQFGRDKNPLENAIRGWRKASGAARPVPLDKPNVDANVAKLLGVIGNTKGLKPVREFEEAVADSAIANVKCKATEERARYGRGKMERFATVKTWRHPDAPFGIVASEAVLETKVNGQMRVLAKMKFILEKFGTTGGSGLPDSR